MIDNTIVFVWFLTYNTVFATTVDEFATFYQ